LLLKQNGRLCCINLDGHVIYRYDISGYRGLAVDQQGHVYISGYMSNDIHRLSPDGTFRDIVLSEHDGVDRPDGVTFNNDFTKLFIINRGKTVLVYSCKWKIFIFCKWRIFIIFVNEGFLYFVEGFLYFVDEGFLYLVN
jgi:hypothetical protein